MLGFVGAKIVLWVALPVFAALGWYGHSVAEHGATIPGVTIHPIIADK